MTHCHTLIQTLRSLGCRITPQREMIVEAVAHAEGHASAEEVYAQVKERTKAVNLATVYRTLDLLVEKGLASRTDLWDGHVAYATLQHGPHIHLVCRCCGAALPAQSRLLDQLGEQINTEYGFRLDLQHMSMVGVCAGCREKEN